MTQPKSSTTLFMVEKSLYVTEIHSHIFTQQLKNSQTTRWKKEFDNMRVQGDHFCVCFYR